MSQFWSKMCEECSDVVLVRGLSIVGVVTIGSTSGGLGGGGRDVESAASSDLSVGTSV